MDIENENNSVLEIQSIVAKLKSSPMFAMSLSSKELFHSNVLAWMFEQFPQFTNELFSEFMDVNFNSPKIVILREKKNNDLTIEFDEGVKKHKIIIENKVKSSIDFKQLERISEKAAKDKSSLTLILLSPYIHENIEEMTVNENIINDWKFLSYKKLADRIEEELLNGNNIDSDKTESFRVYIKDYVGLIRNISQLSDRFLIKSTEEKYDFYSTLYHDLKEIRIHDLYLKTKYTEMMNELLKKINFKNYNFKDKEKIGHIIVSTNFTRGTGIIELFRLMYINDESIDNKIIKVYLAIQIQGTHFRICCLAPSEVNHELSRHLRDKGLWFNFDKLFEKLPDNQEYEILGNGTKLGDFNQYSNKYFIYKYIKLPDYYTIRTILDCMLVYNQYIDDNFDKLSAEITSILNEE
jgi:PD-(D/E)XK nuclease superfamily protein